MKFGFFQSRFVVNKVNDGSFVLSQLCSKIPVQIQYNKMFKSSLDISIANVASGFSNANVSGSKVAREATEMGHFAPKKAKMEEKPHEQEHLSEVQKNERMDR